ncbi:MAG: TlpA family protein disulfide reductase [Dehalococcoidia bacterium]|nr:TlpA family protein disulfide reductase [Dehalococcoidia bacterium]
MTTTDTPSPPAIEVTRRSIARALLGAGAALALVLIVAGFALASPAPPERIAAPPFELPLLDGGSLNSDELRGEVVVINVWASWCPPCREEAPTLSRVAADLEGSGVSFLGVVQDDTEASARAFAAEADLDFRHAIDDGSFDHAYQVQVLPTTYVLDANGGLVATHLGPITEARLRVLIEEAQTSTASDGEAAP